jgi:hypothetical protein
LLDPTNKIAKLQTKWTKSRAEFAGCKTFTPATNISHRHILCMVDAIHLSSLISAYLEIIGNVLLDNAHTVNPDDQRINYRLPASLQPLTEAIADHAIDLLSVIKNAQPLKHDSDNTILPGPF